MKTFIMISWRNLWRQKRRSLVVISSISVGIFAMVFCIGFMNGLLTQMVDNTISSTLGHVAVHKKGFQDSMRPELNFVPSEDLMKALGADPEIASAEKLVRIQGIVRSSEASRSVMITGVDPEASGGCADIRGLVKKDRGRFLSGSDADEVLVSKAMAEKLDVGTGDRLVVMMQDSRGEIAGVGLTVCGLFESPMDGLDKYVIFTGLRKLQDITGLGDALSEIRIMARGKSSAEAVATRVLSGLERKDLEVLTWKQMAPNLVGAIDLQDTMMYIFFAIVFFTVIFSVANTLIMSIMERFHELGVMKCVGTRPSRIFLMVLFEALSLGSVGLASGLALSWPLVLLLGRTGIDLGIMAESLRKWGAGSVIYPSVRAGDIAAAVAVVVITTVAASVYPAVKAARIKPLEALNYI